MAAPTQPKLGPITPSLPGITILGPGDIGASDYTPPSDYLNPPDPEPTAPGGGSNTSPAVLKKTAPLPQTLAVTAEGALINLMYGTVPARYKIFAVGTIDTYLVLGLLWGKGECEACLGVYANKTELTASQVMNYTGSLTQQAALWLTQAIPGYDDDLPGLCYSVVKISQAEYTSLPVFTSIWEARKIYDPRDSSTAFSENPALAFRDMALLGGLAVDDASIIATANACDALISTAPRRKAGVVFNTPNSIDALLATLAKYAGGLYVRDAGLAKLIPNRPASSVASFTDVETDGTRLKILKDSLTIRKLSADNLPNRVVVEYTDTTRIPWGRAFAVAPLAMPSAPRSTTLKMSGVQSYAQARREAIEQLNYYTLTDLEISFIAFDDGLELEPGDVFDVTHSDGLTAKLFRCTKSDQAGEVGHWAISGREYDPGQHSDEELADPTFNDTNLPDPAAVPDAPIPVLDEVIYQLQNETWATRLVATWAAVTDYAYSHEFEVRAYIGSALIWTVRTTDHEAAMGPLQEGETYDIDLYVVGAGGIKGGKGTANILALGKQLAPEFLAGAQLRGNEAGGRVFLNWDAANDDIWTYELRYGTSGQAWAAMTVLTQVDALYYIAETIPPGTWDIKVRAIDSVGVESSNELTLAGLAVTSDADSYAQVDAQLDVNTSTNMTLQGNDWMPDNGTSWNTLFPNAMNTYTEPLATYGGSFTTIVVSDEHDIGTIISANFQFSANTELLVGALDYTMQIADTSGGPYTDYAALSANASGRYARLKVTGYLTDRFVLRPEYFHLVALVSTITKEGEGTSSATVASTVTLDAEYSKMVSIKIQPISASGAEDLVGVPDNIVMGPGNTKFDVYIMDGGTQVARDFYYTARVIK